jgi:hypothetical protein
MGLLHGARGGRRLTWHGSGRRAAGCLTNGEIKKGARAWWAGLGKMGQMANGSMKKKENNIQILKLIARKLITENLVAEIIGNSQKIVGN